ncbi:hypothetical protein [Streptomyces sp. NPDC001652]|uniref:hypothetical protein n=1 Tax=Streptomyces sp. NPDC001652 TaxID=3154393 RepID=UPI0033225166
MSDPEMTVLVGADVRAIREWLLLDLRCARALNGAEVIDLSEAPRPELVRKLFGLAEPPAVRVFLAHLLVSRRTAVGVTAMDAALWIDAAGLRGERTDVRCLARESGLSTRQVHRRIRAVDASMARMLTQTDAALVIEETRAPDRLDAQELWETAHAETLMSRDPARAADALVALSRNRSGNRSATPLRDDGPVYRAGNKDARYRDAGRAVNWLATVAHRPPLAPFRDPTELTGTLVKVEAVALTDDPHESLDQLERALNSNQREALPLLLHHTGRLVPDVAVAGVHPRLRYLALAYFATFEPQNVHALRFARARQDEALRYSPRGMHDWNVFKGMAGRAFMLGVLGHHGAAVQGYLAATRLLERHRPYDTAYLPDLSDAYGRIAHHEALRGGNRERAHRAITRMERIAATQEDPEIHYTLARTKLEVELGFGIRRRDLTLDPSRPELLRRIDRAFELFIEQSLRIGKPNRELTACNLSVLYATASRDGGMLDDAVRRFKQIVALHGGYANQARQLNARIRTATALSRTFSAVPEVTSRFDPLSAGADTVPRRLSGLLIEPAMV